MHVSLEGGLFNGKTECTWETTNYMGFQPLVFAGVVRSLLIGKDSFVRWILLVKTNISVRKLVFESCGSFFEKEDCAHVSRLFWPV